jgi:Na+-transporting NADH:ubiquinone oxidoreductase subunit C
VREQLKIIGFAAVVCLVCSILLAFASTVLSPLQDRNKANDIKTKVLAVFGEKVLDKKGKLCVSLDELDAVFEKRISGIVLDSEGNVLEDKKVSELTPREISDIDKETGLKAFYPVYVYENSETGTKLYGIHVSGKGLWSTIKAYMALEPDLSTISGVVFYEHQETPGLGGEVEKSYFQNRFIGKRWLEDGVVQEFAITKPGMAENDHSIDGITAATMTCNGVEKFLNNDFKVYNKYFEKIRRQK